MRRLLNTVVLLSFAGLTGCSDGLPTETVQQPEEPAAPGLPGADLLSEAVADAKERVEAALPAGYAPSEIAHLFAEISAAVDARAPHTLRDALTRADAALSALGAAEEAADLAIALDALRLVAEHARLATAPAGAAKD